MEYTFKVSGEQANVLAKGLGELPCKESFGTLLLLKQQAKEQDDERKKAAPVEDLESA